MYHPSILPQHLLSLGPFPFKRLLQNLTDTPIPGRIRSPYTCFRSQKRDPLRPGGVCLGHGLWIVGQERVLQLWKRLQGLWQTDCKAELALSSWNEAHITPSTAPPSQPRNTKVVKADSWGNAHGKWHRACRILPGTTRSCLPGTLSLILLNKDILLTLLR